MSRVGPSLYRAIDPLSASARAEIDQIIFGTSDRARIETLHPITGCRADQLMGAWLYPHHLFVPMFDAAWQIVESGEISVIAQQSARERDAKANDSLIKVDADGIAELAISGPLTKHPTSFGSVFGGSSYIGIRNYFREAIKMNAAGTLKGVFIDADSAGGTAEGCAECADFIRRAAVVFPVGVHTEDKALSGMLWLATQGQFFTAGRGAIVGSQGAIMQLLDRSKQYEKEGKKPVVVATGPDKIIGAPGLEITEEQKATLQAYVDAINEPFAADVKASRKLSKAQSAEIAKAGIHVGADAVRVGLVDKICTRDEALAEFKSFIIGKGSGGPTRQPTNPPAGDPTMPAQSITPSHVNRIKLLPFAGCKVATEGDGIDILIVGAETAAADIAALTTGKTDLAGQVSTLTGERDEALKKIPGVTTPEQIKSRAGMARLQIENLKLNGKISAAWETAINAKIGEAGKENAAFLSGPEGATVFDHVIGVLKEGNATPPPQGSVVASFVVPDPKATPAAQDGGAAAGVAQGKAYAEQRLAQQGVK